ncbi:MAG: nicotinamidase [Anaerolineae bacterium]
MIPAFYHPERVGLLYAPNAASSVEMGRRAGLKPSATDRFRTLLLLVDAQVDFVHADGALSVPGAVEDTRRTIEWLYRNAGEITTIAASLDSHVPIQIFFPTWWIDSEGRHPAPFTTIHSGDVERGRWRALYDPEWSQEYVDQLEQRSRKELMIWPYHVLIGTVGHSLTPALYEAVAFHTAARQSQPLFLAKGSIPKTEHYSILEPEVKVPEAPLGSLNTDFLSMIATYDRIFIAGQAKSHCVLETVSSMMRYFQDRPDTIAKMRVLMDCTSSVVHPEIDFDEVANEAFSRFEDAGLTLTRSTETPA